MNIWSWYLSIGWGFTKNFNYTDFLFTFFCKLEWNYSIDVFCVVAFLFTFLFPFMCIFFFEIIDENYLMWNSRITMKEIVRIQMVIFTTAFQRVFSTWNFLVCVSTHCSIINITCHDWSNILLLNRICERPILILFPCWLR